MRNCKNREQDQLHGAALRIGVIVDWMNPTMTAAFQQLSARAKLDLIYPEKQMLDLAGVRVQNDLYILKSGTELALSLAGALHALGAVTLNPYPTVAMMRNKIIVTRMLQDAGLPVPASYVASDPSEFAPLLESGPLILKPYRGSRGAGIRIIRDARELEGMKPNGLLLAQRYQQADGTDRKIYCIGGELFGVKRIWPLRTYEDKVGEPFAVTSELREIALRCGRVFGIDLYGLDVVISAGQPYVVDVQKFGSYMGVPDAPRRLADYIQAAAQRVLRGGPVQLPGERKHI